MLTTSSKKTKFVIHFKDQSVHRLVNISLFYADNIYET